MGLSLINMLTEVCEECVQDKQHRGNFSKDAGCRKKCHLEVVYLDIYVPLQVDSIGGDKYFVTLIDDFSIKLWTYLIKRKHEALEVFKKFKSIVERQSDHKIKTLKIYGKGEYVSNNFEKFYDKEGIVHEVVPPYTPQQNGVADRKNQSIMNMVRTMLKGKNLPKEI